MNPIDIAKQCIAANEKGHCVLYPSDAVALYEVSKALEAAERERDELRAEIARRDSAAGEPVAWQYRYNDGKVGDWHTVDSESECNHLPCYERRPIYTAAQPDVLANDHTSIDSFNMGRAAGYAQAIADAKVTAAQQQKVVELPYLSEDTLRELAALDAANVKWEVKK